MATHVHTQVDCGIERLILAGVRARDMGVFLTGPVHRYRALGGHVHRGHGPHDQVHVVSVPGPTRERLHHNHQNQQKHQNHHKQNHNNHNHHHNNNNHGWTFL